MKVAVMTAYTLTAYTLMIDSEWIWLARKHKVHTAYALRDTSRWGGVSRGCFQNFHSVKISWAMSDHEKL